MPYTITSVVQCNVEFLLAVLAYCHSRSVFVVPNRNRTSVTSVTLRLTLFTLATFIILRFCINMVSYNILPSDKQAMFQRLDDIGCSEHKNSSSLRSDSVPKVLIAAFSISGTVGLLRASAPLSTASRCSLVSAIVSFLVKWAFFFEMRCR